MASPVFNQGRNNTANPGERSASAPGPSRPESRSNHAGIPVKCTGIRNGPDAWSLRLSRREGFGPRFGRALPSRRLAFSRLRPSGIRCCRCVTSRRRFARTVHLVEQLDHPGSGLARDAVVHLLPDAAWLDEPAEPQACELLRQRRLSQRKQLLKLGDVSLASSQMAEDKQAVFVRQGLQQCARLLYRSMHFLDIDVHGWFTVTVAAMLTHICRREPRLNENLDPIHRICPATCRRTRARCCCARSRSAPGYWAG